MQNFHVVKEYIIFYLKKRKLTPFEFCKICDISEEDFNLIVESSEKLNMSALKKISDYIYVPIEYLYVDLNMTNNQPILSEFDKWVNTLNDKPFMFYFD